MKKKSHASLFTFLVIFVLISSILAGSFFSKGELELLFNSLHHPILNFLFYNLTYLGDGIMMVVLLALLPFRRYAYGMLMGIGGLIHWLFVLLGKRVLFPYAPRPALFFEGMDFYQVPGLVLHHYHSFPSGHTLTAFTVAGVLSMIDEKKPNRQVIYFILALGVGISRVYLMQHFFLDVWAGALLGLLSAHIGRMITIWYFSGKAFKKGYLPKRKLPLARLPVAKKMNLLSISLPLINRRRV